MSELLPVFETPRLIGRPLSRQDVPALTEILSDPEVMRYSLGGVRDESATRTFIDWCLDCYSLRGTGPWALVEKGTDDLIGFCGVGPERVGDVEEMNLGYRLARRYWYRGLAPEAARGVLEHAFVQRQLESVVVIIEPEHVASMRVAEKAGFQVFSIMDFHGRAVRLYRMSRHEWARRYGRRRPVPSGQDKGKYDGPYS